MMRIVPVLLCSLLFLAGDKAQAVCENCYRVQIELGEAHSEQSDVDGRIEDNLGEMVALAQWRDSIQGAMVELLAEGDYSDSWQIRRLLLEWEWDTWSDASDEAIGAREWLLEEKAEIDHAILLLDEELLYDCEAVGTG